MLGLILLQLNEYINFSREFIYNIYSTQYFGGRCRDRFDLWQSFKIRKQQNTKYENVLENDQLSSRLNSYICPGWIICDRDKEQWFRDVFNGKVNPTKCQNSVRERVWCVRLFGPFEFELPVRGDLVRREALCDALAWGTSRAKRLIPPNEVACAWMSA